MANSLNKNLNDARRNRNDNFYTQLSDIENELNHYKHHFKNRIVYCNCDDPTVSNFFKYFSLNFQHLKLKKLITTCYKSQQSNLFSNHDNDQAIMLEYDGFRRGDRIPNIDDIGITNLKSDGSFCSDECIEILKNADIVVTNPPFSLFREYVPLLVEHNIKFVIVGPSGAVTYADIFPLIKNNQVWLGHGFVGPARFSVPNSDELVSFGNVTWFTNLEHNIRHEDLILYRLYDPNIYPKYDNYDAIEVNYVSEIPMDWEGVMGVPPTFLNKYNPNQFEIIGMGEDNGRHQSGGVWRGGVIKMFS